MFKLKNMLGPWHPCGPSLKIVGQSEWWVPHFKLHPFSLLLVFITLPCEGLSLVGTVGLGLMKA